MSGFGDAAFAYLAKGYDPIPVPHERKSPPPVSYTGRGARVVSGADVQSWIDGGHSGSNIALHLRRGVIGLDFDLYKAGARDEYDRLTELLGPLPATVRSTAREDGSGILLYRTPDDAELQTQLGSAGEIVQAHHRYVVAAPSTHPEGPVYRWLDENNTEVPVPAVDDLPLLPTAWLDQLAASPPATVTDPDAAPVRLTDGPMSDAVTQRLQTALDALSVPHGSRHDSTLGHIGALVRFAEQGHGGVASAVESLRTEYISRVGAERGGDDIAAAEFDSMLVGAQVKVGQTPTPAEQLDGPRAAAEFMDDQRTDTASPAERADTDTDTDIDAGDWSFVDLSTLEFAQAQHPEILERQDGLCLIYPGMSHTFYGQSESGKSWIVLWACVEQIAEGHDVLYIDYESNPRLTRERLRALGASTGDIAAHFRYVYSPSTPIPPRLYDNDGTPWRMVVVDGMTVFLSTYAASSDSNDDIAGVEQRVVKPIKKTGAAFVSVDHVVKSGERSAYAIGAQSKRALTEVSYLVEMSRKYPIGRGRSGEILIFNVKDRNGFVRERLEANQIALAAKVDMVSEGDTVRITVATPDLQQAVDAVTQLVHLLNDVGAPLAGKDSTKKWLTENGHTLPAAGNDTWQKACNTRKGAEIVRTIDTPKTA